MQFLLFTLYAPMGSFGEIAVGERRMSWARPGRSAVFGLVAAALGIERADEAGHRNLETGLYFAVRTDAAGRPFIDYHTAQTPKARKGRSFTTRRKEVMSGDSYTVLSSREWLADPCFTVSLWRRPGWWRRSRRSQGRPAASSVHGLSGPQIGTARFAAQSRDRRSSNVRGCICSSTTE